MALIERKFLLQVPSATENLAIVRDFLSSVGNQTGMPEEEVCEIQLAVDEACANVIEHAYGNDETKEVMIRVSVDDRRFKIEIVDTGRGFDPATIEPQSLEELIASRKTGGLGLRLIETLMDEVHYDIEPGKKNQIRMVKKIAQR